MERKLDYLHLDWWNTSSVKVGDFERRLCAVLIEKKLSIHLIDWAIELRSFREWDEPFLWDVANSEKIAKNFIGFPHPYTFDDAKSWVASNQELASDSIGLAIIYKGVLVGWIHLAIENTHWKPSGILSFWLWDNFTGNGIMQRSLEVFVEYLFAQTYIQEVRAHIFCTNTESQGLIKKIWFRETKAGVPVEKEGIPIFENIYNLDQIRFERLRYIRFNRDKIEQTFVNFEDFISDYLALKKWTYALRLRSGKVISLRARNEEVSDIDIVWEIFIDRDYDLAPLSHVENPVVVDIGAQIGLFSVFAATELRNPNIYSYEPFPESYDLLSKNAKWSPIRHFPRAVSGKTWTSNLFVSRDNVGGHTIVDGKTENTIAVETLSLSDLMQENQIEKIDLLKMDCEWSEYEIFFSLEWEILSRIANIYMEVHYNPTIAKKYEKWSMVDFLKSKGFDVKIIKEFYYEWEGEFYVLFATNINSV